jgi:hypothetical protein
MSNRGHNAVFSIYKYYIGVYGVLFLEVKVLLGVVGLISFIELFIFLQRSYVLRSQAAIINWKIVTTKLFK